MCGQLKAFPMGPEVGTGRPGMGPSLFEHLPSRNKVGRRGRSLRPPAGPHWRSRGGRQWAAGALEPLRKVETGFDCARWMGQDGLVLFDTSLHVAAQTDRSSCRTEPGGRHQAADGLAEVGEMARRWSCPYRHVHTQRMEHLRRRLGKTMARVWKT